MEPFKLEKDADKISSINRTIRMKPEIFEKITILSEESGISFNKIANQCLEYALDNMEKKS
ncbi:MAG: hypothetical protein R3Y63_11510 [Eubacteriales bacterium]